MKIDLYAPGIAELLVSSAFAAAVHDVAEEIAGNARPRTDAPIEVRDYVTDRAASSVSIAHPKGLAAQAKHGVLTKAAATAGYEVVSR